MHAGDDAQTHGVMLYTFQHNLPWQWQQRAADVSRADSADCPCQRKLKHVSTQRPRPAVGRTSALTAATSVRASLAAASARCSAAFAAAHRMASVAAAARAASRSSTSCRFLAAVAVRAESSCRCRVAASSVAVCACARASANCCRSCSTSTAGASSSCNAVWHPKSPRKLLWLQEANLPAGDKMVEDRGAFGPSTMAFTMMMANFQWEHERGLPFSQHAQHQILASLCTSSWHAGAEDTREHKFCV